MVMEQKEEGPPPFWVQNTAALRRADRQRRGRNQASSLFLNTGVLVVLLLAAAVVFLAIVIPSVLSLARQVFNPSLVKSSWNSLNLILVLFAIVCGFLGKRDDDQTPVSSPMRRDSGKSAESSPSPRQWYGYHQQSRMEYNSFGNVDTMRSLRRNRNSYPDLRQDGTWAVNENRWRFYDDTHVDNYQVQRSDSGNSRISRSRSMGVLDEDDIDIKNIEVDSFVSGAKEVAPPSPPAQPAARKSHYRSRSREVADEKDQYVTKNIEMDTSVSYQAKYQRHESNPSMVNKPVPPSQPSYSQQPYSPPSPQSPINYFWPSPSPPPPPPPPPPQRAYSSVPAKKKHGNKRNKDKQAQSESKSMNEIQMPPPPPPPPPPSYFMHQPLTPPSPNHYFWPPPSPPPPPPPPPPPRTHSSNIAKKKHENKRNTPSKTESRSKAQTQIPTPPPPPPQLRPILGNISEHKTNTSEDTREKKKGIVIRTLNRFPRRRKRQSRRSYENLSEFIEPPKASIHRSKSTPEFPPSSPPPPTPPPPPPPPPPSMFHNMFSKKGKTKKKDHSTYTSTSSPPSPPPLPARPLPKTRIKPPSTRRPAPPTKTDSFSSIDDNIGNGSESPLIPIPPPPPPPPFKMPSWKYIMQGDYVKIVSNNNSPRSGYSASEDEGNSPSNHKTSMPSRLSCPSPDVNTKADDFIARFRAKLTLEKMNSIKRNNSSDPSPLGSESGQP